MHLTKFKGPLLYRFIGHDDTARDQYFFDVSQAQGKAEVAPYHMADYFRRITEAAVNIGFQHRSILGNIGRAIKLIVPKILFPLIPSVERF